MPKVVVIYKLKPGATMEQYKKFSKEIDQVITPKQKVVEKFEVYEVDEYIRGAGEIQKDNPPYQVFELIDVKDFGEWIRTTQSEGFKPVGDGWVKVGDAGTIIVLSGKKIEK